MTETAARRVIAGETDFRGCERARSALAHVEGDVHLAGAIEDALALRIDAMGEIAAELIEEKGIVRPQPRRGPGEGGICRVDEVNEAVRYGDTVWIGFALDHLGAEPGSAEKEEG